MYGRNEDTIDSIVHLAMDEILFSLHGTHVEFYRLTFKVNH